MFSSVQKVCNFVWTFILNWIMCYCKHWSRFRSNNFPKRPLFNLFNKSVNNQLPKFTHHLLYFQVRIAQTGAQLSHLLKWRLQLKFNKSQFNSRLKYLDKECQHKFNLGIQVFEILKKNIHKKSLITHK